MFAFEVSDNDSCFPYGICFNILSTVMIWTLKHFMWSFEVVYIAYGN